MARTLFMILVLVFFTVSWGEALQRPDVEYKVFQFPANMIPRIDGNIDDWNIVTDDYIINTDELTDEKTPGRPLNKESLDVKVRVGWVKGLNRLYFCVEMYDDYWNTYYNRGDIFEILVDADLSGGNVITNPQLERGENYFKYQGIYGQNYHIYTAPGEGRDWTMIWGCQPWIKDLPWSNHAYSHEYKMGESGNIVLEFFITPFDFAPYDPVNAVPSKLVENTLIGLTWTIIDYDGNNDPKNINDDNGFWSISHHLRSYQDASTCIAFRLMPLLPQFRKSIEAEWSFKVLDMDRRLVAFQDESYGEITSWLWDFDDGTTSTEQHPIHEFQRSGNRVVVLTVKGAAGESKRIKVWDVHIR